MNSVAIEKLELPKALEEKLKAAGAHNIYDLQCMAFGNPAKLHELCSKYNVKSHQLLKAAGEMQDSHEAHQLYGRKLPGLNNLPWKQADFSVAPKFKPNSKEPTEQELIDFGFAKKPEIVKKEPETQPAPPEPPLEKADSMKESKRKKSKTEILEPSQSLQKSETP